MIEKFKFLMTLFIIELVDESLYNQQESIIRIQGIVQ